jgi:Tfp pilus assembly protein PilX
MNDKFKYAKGNILASTLLVMLAMNLLGVALVQTSMREFKVADFNQIESNTLYLAESCVNSSVAWFKTFDTAPTTLPYTITRANISNLYSGTETTQMLNYLSKYSYNCTTTSLTVKSVEASSVGMGESVDSSDAYGLSGDLAPKYYYQIESNGIGPNNSAKKIYYLVLYDRK